MDASIDWKQEIVKLAYIKQVLAEVDTQHLHPWHLPKVAATPAMIKACERVLGFPLARDHAEFLLYADGWDGFEQTTDLFGTHDFAASKRYQAAQEMLKEYSESIFAEIGQPKECVFPIGASFDCHDLIVMLKSAVPGISRVFWIEPSQEVERYPSFTDFFFSMMDLNRWLVQMERQRRQ